MKLLIIGSSVFDKIISGEKVTESAGGIYHTVLKMQQIKSEEDSLALCTKVSLKNYNFFSEVFDKCDEKLFEEVENIPEVTLEEFSSGCRREVYSNLPEPLNLDGIEFVKYDGILVNMITGEEFDFAHLNRIRNNSKALIYFDVHTLSRKSNSIGERKIILIPDFEKWAESVDIIQVNEFELISLFGISDEKSVSELLFSLGVKALIVTKSERGAIVYFSNNGELNFYFKSAEKIEGVNTIGCGDYFGASFFYNYLITNNPFFAMNFAVDEVEKILKEKLNAVK